MRWTLMCRKARDALADGEIVWSWRPDAGVKSCGRYREATGANKPGTPGRSRINRNTIAQGMPVVLAEPVVLPPAFFVAGGPWVRLSIRHSLCLCLRRDVVAASPGQIMPRECGRVSSSLFET